MSHPPALQRLPHPWLDNSWPKPRNRPDVFYQLKFFLVAALPPNYPYRPFRERAGEKIHYFLFSGSGPPPSDIGYPGDIYRDASKQFYEVYGRLQDRWMPWTGISASDGDLPIKTTNLIPHPNFPHHFLWCREADITWFSERGLRLDAKHRAIDLAGGFLDVSRLVSAVEGHLWPGQKRQIDDSESEVEGNAMKKSKMAKQLQSSEDRSAHDVSVMLKEENHLLLENISLLRAEREDFQSATKALDRQVQNLQAQIVTLKKKHHKTLAKTHKWHESKLSSGRAIHREDTTEIKRLRTDHAAITAMFQDKKNEAAALGERNAQLEGEIAELDIARQERKKFEEEVRHLGKDTEKLRADNLALKEDICKSDAIRERLEESSKQVGEELGTLRAHNLRLKEELRRSGTKCSRLEAEVKKSGGVSSTLHAQSKRLEDDLAAMRKLLATTDQEAPNSTLATLRKTIQDLEGKNQNLQQRCGRLEKIIAPQTNQATKSKELLQANQQLRAKVAFLEEDRFKAQEENQLLQEQLAQELKVVDRIRNAVAGTVGRDTFDIGSVSAHLRNWENTGLQCSGESERVVKKECLKADPELISKLEE